MGEILRVTCPKCGYGAELFVGGGLADCNQETALAIGGNDKGLAEALQKNARFEIGRNVARCSSCRKFIVDASVKYWRADGFRRRIGGVCPDCGGKLSSVDLEAKRLPCPSCGGSVTVERTGRWD